ncbi:MAG: 2-C-methyl-D-erythritol 2,4-cyclodiphosphate synthase [Planctomycetaceae bacterium]|nr:2-C-methyl-D-erythritol 2,4-cyclodiphosphate synthase [Planctomycetaceae bacterium]
MDAHMQELPVYRVGEGHDTHRTVSGRPLMLGGVHVTAEFGLDGHSDADVLLHAVIDAILGATGQGDIGEWFPNTAAEWKDADSVELLQHVTDSVVKDGWKLENLDCTICAERPRLGEWKPQIRRRLADLLNVSSADINVKAKSGEAVGPVGRGEAITASAVVLMTRMPKDSK